MLALSVRQYRKIAVTLGAGEVPDGYWINAPVLSSLAIAVIGLMLAAYLALV